MAKEPKESEVDATAAAQEHAEKHGVDLSTVEGTGADGKITKADVEGARPDDDEAAAPKAESAREMVRKTHGDEVAQHVADEPLPPNTAPHQMIGGPIR